MSEEVEEEQKIGGIMRKLSVFILMGLILTSFTPARTPEETVEIIEEETVEIVEPVKIRKPEPFKHDASVCVEVTDDHVESKNDYLEELSDEDRADILALAQTAKGEFFLTDTAEHRMMCAAVMWCVCFRSAQGSSKGFRDTIRGCAAQPYQFLGYDPNSIPGDDLMALAEDVFLRFREVQNGASLFDSGCVIQSEYLWFLGNGSVNVFRNSYKGGTVWDWSMPNPYEEEI